MRDFRNYSKLYVLAICCEKRLFFFLDLFNYVLNDF